MLRGKEHGLQAHHELILRVEQSQALTSPNTRISYVYCVLSRNGCFGCAQDHLCFRSSGGILNEIGVMSESARHKGHARAYDDSEDVALAHEVWIVSSLSYASECLDVCYCNRAIPSRSSHSTYVYTKWGLHMIRGT